jgi:hypothetical protein
MVSLLFHLSTQMEQRHIADTRTRLEDARQALIVFAIINGATSRPGDDCQRRPRGFGRRRLHGTCDGFPPARPAWSSTISCRESRQKRCLAA